MTQTIYTADERAQAPAGTDLLVQEQLQAEARLAELTAELEAVGTDLETEVTFDDEDAEGATSSHDRERVVALLASARRHLQDVREALARVDAGTYGVCERCGQPIPPERLEALPAAKACVTCLDRNPLRRRI
jgi:DnaK suppressor protein